MSAEASSVFPCEHAMWRALRPELSSSDVSRGTEEGDDKRWRATGVRFSVHAVMRGEMESSDMGLHCMYVCVCMCEWKEREREKDRYKEA